MEKLSNEEKVARYKKRKILYWLIIIFGFATIVLAVLSLVIKISPIYSLICFVLEAIFSKIRDKSRINEEEKEKV